MNLLTQVKETVAVDKETLTSVETRRWVLLGAVLATLMSSLDTSVVNIALPTIIKDMHTSFESAQWIVLGYMLVVTSLIVGVGRLGDLWGKKGLYLAGLAFFTLASLCCGAAPNVAVLVGMRTVQGLGAAIMMALSFAIVSDVYPKKEFGYAVGVLSAMVSFGIALGPALGGILVGTIGWPAIFYVNIPLGIVASITILRFLPTLPPKPEKHRFDWLGTVGLVGILICYVLAMTEAESLSFRSPLVLTLLAGAIVGLGLFLWVERRAAEPLLPLKLFNNLLLSASLFISILVYAIMMTASLVLPFFLDEAAHFSLIVSGLLMAAGPLVTALFSVPAGWLANRIGSRVTMIIGLLLMALGCLFMSTLTVEAGIAGFVARLAMINLGLALFQTPNNGAVMETAVASQRGVVSGLLALSRTLGLTTGAAVMGSVFAELVILATHSSVGKVTTSPVSITIGVQGIFLISAVIATTSLILAIFVLWYRMTNSK